MSPQATTKAKLEVWREFGLSRLSLGVQTLTPSVLRHTGRSPQSLRCVEQAFSAARSVGIEAVCVDLLAGLPGETVESFLETLKAIDSLKPDQIQIFRWISEPKCPEYQTCGPMTKQALVLREEILAAAQNWLDNGPGAGSYLGRQAPFGLDYLSRRASLFHVRAHYEVLRSAQSSILGVGLAAYSGVQGILRYSSTGSFEQYLRWPESSSGVPFTGTRVSRKFAMASWWAASMDEGFVDGAVFAKRFGQTLDQTFPREIAFLTRMGWLLQDGERYVMAPGIGRHEAIHVGALVFSLKDLQRARQYQLFLQNESNR